MPTETELVNAALRKAGGAKRINALTDAVGSAGIANDILTSERDDLLRSGVWNFAITRVQLAQLSVVPVFEYSFAYALPGDCMRVVNVSADVGGGTSLGGIGGTVDGEGIPYKLESIKQVDGSYVNCLVSDANTIFLKYCRQITDPNLMSPSFRQVLILRMAKIFAISVAKSNSLYQGLSEEEKRAFSEAKSVDGIEDYPDKRPEGSWAASRRAYGWRNGNSSGFF